MNLSISSFKNKYIRGAAYFAFALLLFILFDRILFFSLRESMFRFYQKNNYEKNVFGRLQFIKKNYFNTLIMGTSRTEYSIHPIYLYQSLGLKALSVAKRERYPKFHYNFYVQYKKKYGKPRLLIYGTDYFMFRRNSAVSEMNLVTDQKKKQIKRLPYKKMTNPNSPLFSRVSLLFRSRRKVDSFVTDILDYLTFIYESKVKGDALPPGISHFKGWPGKIRPEDQREPIKWEKSPYSRFPGREGEYFRKLLDELKKDRVKVFLVNIPEYINTYRTNFEQEKYQSDIKNLAAKYRNVEFLNFNSTKLFDLSNPVYFRDGKFGDWNSHLSIYGAYYLSQKLSQRLKQYIKKARNVNLN